MSAVEIDVYADVVCPWCFIGHRRLESVLRDEPDAIVRHHPYILQAGAPPEGEDLHAMLRDRYGTEPQAMFARVEEAAHDSGIPLDLSKQPMTYNTVAAHTLLRHASGNETQRALLGALFSAYFIDARNIADADVLADIASHHGFSADEARRLVSDPAELSITVRESGAAAQRGIRGVPLFIVNRRLVLSGAQSEETFRETIRKAQEE
jgi:predicted DsbA family dithiol-disulfide isomerase